MRCLDCGNKAKKDCVHYRCRTCCKGRGFRCQTHLKSTWIPVSTRQQVLQRSAAAAPADSSSTSLHLHHHHRQDQQLQLIPSTVANTSTPDLVQFQHQRSHPSSRFRDQHYPSSSSGLGEGNLPPEVTTTATFVCLRVTSTSGESQYAYQTSVAIGGHVFKGILYDQGPDDSTVMNAYGINVAGGGQQTTSANIGSDTAVDLLNVNNVTASSSSNPPNYSFLF